MGEAADLFLTGEQGPNLTQCRRGRGIPTTWHLAPSSRLATTDMERNFFFGGGHLGPHPTQCGEAEAYLHAQFHLHLSNRLATNTNFTDRTGQTDRQDRTRHGRIGQDNGPIAQVEPFYKRSTKN